MKVVLVTLIFLVGCSCGEAPPAPTPIPSPYPPSPTETSATETPTDWRVRYEPCLPDMQVGDKVQIMVVWTDRTRGMANCVCSDMREVCLEALGKDFFHRHPGWDEGETALLFEGTCQPCPFRQEVKWGD